MPAARRAILLASSLVAANLYSVFVLASIGLRVDKGTAVFVVLDLLTTAPLLMTALAIGRRCKDGAPRRMIIILATAGLALFCLSTALAPQKVVKSSLRLGRLYIGDSTD